MASNSLPITANPAPSPPTGAPSAASSVAPETATDPGSDFVQMLADLMSTSDASPQTILNALQTLQAQKANADQDALQAPDASLLLDPQLALLLAGGAQLVNAVNAATPNTNRAIGDGANRAAQSAGLDLGVLGILASQSDSKNLAASLLADVSSDDASAQNFAKHLSQGEGTQPDGAVNVMAATTQNRTDDVTERAPIRAHVGTPAWADELAGKLTVMIDRGVHSASLQLSPEQLGPLEIRITVQNDQTSVWFGAAHAATRSALEEALPRLREMLAGQGLNLSDAGVSHEAPRDRSKAFFGGDENRDGEREIAISSIAARGIVDAYA